MTLSRRVFVGGATAALAFSSSGARAANVVRIGYQKYGNLLLLKATGLLEERLKPIGWSVEWKSFVSGPPLMEALGAGAIDFGTAGETPPIFAQAAGAPLLYLGSEAPSPRGEAILVHESSSIRSLADLRGKKVALNKGSNVHCLYIRALEKAGLAPSEVTPVYLAPADGRAAFERGSVDAWVIWDPFLAAAQAALPTRTLADGTGLAANRQFYLGSRRFTNNAVTDAIRQAIIDVDKRTDGDPGKVADLLSASVGLPPPVIRVALQRQSFAFQPIDATIVHDQQVIADTFQKLGLIPKPIRISDALPSA
jgi:sulfonate transport system substrate-binding protein